MVNIYATFVALLFEVRSYRGRLPIAALYPSYRSGTMVIGIEGYTVSRRKHGRLSEVGSEILFHLKGLFLDHNFRYYKTPKTRVERKDPPKSSKPLQNKNLKPEKGKSGRSKSRTSSPSTTKGKENTGDVKANVMDSEG